MHVLDDTYVLDNVVKFIFSDRTEVLVLEVRPTDSKSFYKQFSNHLVTKEQQTAIFQYSQLEVKEIICPFFVEGDKVTTRSNTELLMDAEDFRKRLLRLKSRVNKMQIELNEMNNEIQSFLNR